MSLTQTTTGDIGSSSSPLRTPAPTETTPESDADDSDVGSVSALHGGGHTFELRKIRNSSEKGSRHGSFDQEEASSEDDSEKEDVRPVRRVGSRSREYTHAEEQTIVRKFDRRLTLFIALLYMLSFLDRSS
jgi:hypothetical protein